MPAPAFDSSVYASNLAQWFDSQATALNAKLDALAASHGSLPEIGFAVIVVGLLLWLWARSIQHETQLNKPSALLGGGSNRSEILRELQAISATQATLLKGLTMASTNLTNLTNSIGLLSPAVGNLVTGVNTLIAQSADDAALPALQATVDSLTSQANAAVGQIPAPPVQQSKT